jgi:drug/metabolite transporter (DMT)-like permease
MTSAPITRAPARLFGNAYLLLALAGLCWSVNHILGRAIAGHVPPFALSCVRYFLAALVLYPFARAHLGQDWPLVRARIGVLVYLAVIGGGLFSASQFLGLQLTVAMNVSVMNSLGPVLIAAVSAVMFGDRLTGRQMLGVAVSLTGVLAEPGVLHEVATFQGLVTTSGYYGECLPVDQTRLSCSG